MTCIAAFINESGTITMGGDSAGINPDTGAVDISSQAKVLKTCHYLIGSCGFGSAMDILRYAVLPVPAVGTDVVRFMRVDFLKFLKEILPEDIEAKNEFLVGIQGHLFHYWGARQVGEVVEPFDAIGSGAPYAKGVLYAVQNVALTSHKKVYMALSAAERFNNGCRGPHIIFSDRLEQSE